MLAAMSGKAGFPLWARAPLTTGDGVDVPWLGDVQRTPETALENPPQLSDLRHPEGEPAVTSLEDWRRERSRLRKEWLEFLGPMPEKRPPVTLATVSEDHPDGVTRRLVRYEGEPGITVEGYLLIPDRELPGADEKGRRAGLVALHPTTNDTIHEIAGVRGPDDQQIGLKLARRGFVVFCPLCFLWHDCIDIPDAVRKFHERRPETKGMAKMLYDAQRGVDVLESLTELVDPARLGAVGHSLGAKETLYLQAFDDRIQAGVFSEGGIGFPSTNWNAPWYLGPAIQEDSFPLNHHQLLSSAARRGRGPPTATGPGRRSSGRSRWGVCTRRVPGWGSSTTAPATACRRRPGSGWWSGSWPRPVAARRGGGGAEGGGTAVAFDRGGRGFA